MIAKSHLRLGRLFFLPALKKSLGANQAHRAIFGSLLLPLASGPEIWESRSLAAGLAV